MNPTLTVLIYSSVAAVTGGIGSLPLAFRSSPPTRWLGWANALAAGTMLGVAYVLSASEPGARAWELAAGSIVGVLFVHGVQRAAGTLSLDLNRLEQEEAVYGYKVLLATALHAASEGVAIGAAMLVNLPLGIFMALAIALHNIPEGLALAAVLRAQGLTLGHAASLTVAANLNQVLFAVVTFALAQAAPGLLPWALGVAVGSLVQIVMTDLFSHAYRQDGHTSVALAAVSALGMVVLLSGG